MNKYKFALLCAAALFAPASKGAVTSANADGYLDRAVRMYVGHNYEGCLDQLSQLLRMDISDSMREEAKLYFNLANFHLNNFDPLAISPASAHRHEMNFMEGSMWFYNENYKAAVAPFEKCRRRHSTRKPVPICVIARRFPIFRLVNTTKRQFASTSLKAFPAIRKKRLTTRRSSIIQKAITKRLPMDSVRLQRAPNSAMRLDSIFVKSCLGKAIMPACKRKRPICFLSSCRIR